MKRTLLLEGERLLDAAQEYLRRVGGAPSARKLDLCEVPDGWEVSACFTVVLPGNTLMIAAALALEKAGLLSGRVVAQSSLNIVDSGTGKVVQAEFVTFDTDAAAADFVQSLGKEKEDGKTNL